MLPPPSRFLTPVPPARLLTPPPLTLFRGNQNPLRKCIPLKFSVLPYNNSLSEKFTPPYFLLPNLAPPPLNQLKDSQVTSLGYLSTPYKLQFKVMNLILEGSRAKNISSVTTVFHFTYLIFSYYLSMLIIAPFQNWLNTHIFTWKRTTHYNLIQHFCNFFKRQV